MAAYLLANQTEKGKRMSAESSKAAERRSKFYPKYKVSVSRTTGGNWVTYYMGTAIFSNTRAEAREMIGPLFEYQEAYARYLRRRFWCPVMGWPKPKSTNPRQPQLRYFINRYYGERWRSESKSNVTNSKKARAGAAIRAMKGEQD